MSTHSTFHRHEKMEKVIFDIPSISRCRLYVSIIAAKKRMLEHDIWYRRLLSAPEVMNREDESKSRGVNV